MASRTDVAFLSSMLLSLNSTVLEFSISVEVVLAVAPPFTVLNILLAIGKVMPLL